VLWSKYSSPKFIDIIKKVVCGELKVGENKIGIKTRKREVVRARQLVSYYAFTIAKLNFFEISINLGEEYFDRNTVRWSVNVVRNEMQTNKGYMDMVEKIGAKIRMVMALGNFKHKQDGKME
jgi:chromosomal replication initiation ATPase DnaA